jgi:hypothetical protein
MLNPGTRSIRHKLQYTTKLCRSLKYSFEESRKQLIVLHIIMKLCIGQIHRNFLIIRQFSSFSSSSSSINNVNINAKERSAVGEGRGARISPGTLDYRAVFLGSDHFSLASLIALTDLLPQGNVSVVVSNESNVIGKWARRNSLEMFLWKDFKSKEFQYPADTGGDRKYDFGVVASFGFLIPSAVIQRFPM